MISKFVSFLASDSSPQAEMFASSRKSVVKNSVSVYIRERYIQSG
ncbi:hypothetical protein OCAR_6854 [Afipia carboxidovorans OM5]|nr:hypothetical protein OCAR_6854 [Afipia carboxidovorans OM5]